MGRVVRQASGTERTRSNCRLGAKYRADRTAIFTETYFSLNKYRHRLIIVFHLKPLTVWKNTALGMQDLGMGLIRRGLWLALSVSLVFSLAGPVTSCNQESDRQRE